MVSLKARKRNKSYPNKAKLVVTKATKQRNERWLNLFTAFTEKPISVVPGFEFEDKHIGFTLKQLMVEQKLLLAEFLRHFVCVIQIGLTVEKVIAPDFAWTNMLNCEDKAQFFAKSAYNTNVSAVIAGLNRYIYQEQSYWKMTHCIVNGNNKEEVPEWVKSPPQIDIDHDALFISVREAADFMSNRCVAFRGQPKPKAVKKLSHGQFVHVLGNIWVKVFGEQKNKKWHEMNLAMIDPRKLMQGIIFLIGAYQPGRGGGERRDQKWVRDVAFDIDGGEIFINPPTKNNRADGKEDKTKTISKSINGKGMYEMLLIYDRLRPNEVKDDVFFCKPLPKGILCMSICFIFSIIFPSVRICV